MWTMRVISSPWKKFAAVARAWTPWWSTWLKRASITPIRRCSSATGDCKDDVEYVAQQIRQRFGTTDIYINPIGPVIGAHSGPGTVALFFLAEGRG